MSPTDTETDLGRRYSLAGRTPDEYGIAYCAFAARWDDVASISRTVARLAAL